MKIIKTIVEIDHNEQLLLPDDLNPDYGSTIEITINGKCVKSKVLGLIMIK